MINKTSIISTLGPASGSAAVISQLMAAGVSTFRLNFSYGTFDNKNSCLYNCQQNK